MPCNMPPVRKQTHVTLAHRCSVRGEQTVKNKKLDMYLRWRSRDRGGRQAVGGAAKLADCTRKPQLRKYKQIAV
jgi:hypothetical protein